MPLPDTRRWTRVFVWLVWGALLLPGWVGCGTNVSEILSQTGSATATTVLDLWLTDFANAAADSFDRPQPTSSGVVDDGDGDGNGGGNGGGNGDGNGGDDPGAAAFAANNCGACHGSNAEGGIGPALAGMDELAALQARFADDATHQGTMVTAQEIEDVAAFLLGDDGGSDGSDGDVAAGQALYAASNCGACHCADGSGGCLPSAPAVVGADFDTLDEILRGGASHPALAADDQELADLRAYLASL